MPRGGARPNSGPKPKHFTDWRKRMQMAFEAAVTEEDVRAATATWIKKWVNGDPEGALMWDRVLGKLSEKTVNESTGTIRVEVEYVHTPPAAGTAPGASADQAGS